MDISFLRITRVSGVTLNTGTFASYTYQGYGTYKAPPQEETITTNYIISYDYSIDDGPIKSNIITVRANLDAQQILDATYTQIESVYTQEQEQVALKNRIQHLHDLKVYNEGINKKGKK